MSATPPGWYDDGHGARRWWDGFQWTEHIQAIAPFTPADGLPAQSPTQFTPAGSGHAASATPYEAPGFASSGATAPGAPVGYPALPPAAPKSRLWILWTVLGLLALGAVITSIVLIPLMLAGLAAVTASEAGQESETAAPSEADESAAIAAVRLYDEAWQQVDCGKYFAATTEAFRNELELPDCATFEENAQDFTDATDDYEIAVTSVVQNDDVITVSTSETYTILLDDDGEPLENPEPTRFLEKYYLIQSGDEWVIDDGGTE